METGNFVASNEAAAYWKFDGNDHLVDGLKRKSVQPIASSYS